MPRITLHLAGGVVSRRPCRVSSERTNEPSRSRISMWNLHRTLIKKWCVMPSVAQARRNAICHTAYS